MNKKLFNFHGTYPSSVYDLKFTIEGDFVLFKEPFSNVESRLRFDSKEYIDNKGGKFVKQSYVIVDIDDPKNYVEIVDVESGQVIDTYLILYKKITPLKEKRLYLLQREDMGRTSCGRTVSVLESDIGVPQTIPLISEKPIYFKFKDTDFVLSAKNLIKHKAVFLNKNISLQKKISLNCKAIDMIDSELIKTKKELIYVGSLKFKVGIDKYYTYDYSEFFNEHKEPIDSEDMDFWAYYLDCPWSQADESWSIKCNCKDAYTKMDETKPQLYCEYKSIGPEGIISTFRAYADTPGDAANKCEVLLKSFKEKYIKED